MGFVEKIARREVALLKPYVCARSTVAKGVLLNANENSFGPALEGEMGDAGFLDAVRGVELSRYPDPRAGALCRAFAEYAGVAPERVVAGNGSDELLDLSVRVFAGKGDEAVDCPPTFSMNAVLARAAGARVVNVPRGAGFEVDFRALKKAVGPKTKIVFITTPNNPTGNACSASELLEFAQGVRCMVFVDEAYAEFGGKSVAKRAGEIENLMVFRTLSKAWGLAGIRCGFLIAGEKATELVLRLKLPYNVNAVSQDVARAALRRGRAKMARAVGKILSERSRLGKALAEKTDWTVYPSDANFLLCRLPRKQSAKGVFGRLLEKGVVVRDFSPAPGLENCLRITVGTRRENDLLLEKISELKEISGLN